jgi:hypothetical protein
VECVSDSKQYSLEHALALVETMSSQDSEHCTLRDSAQERKLDAALKLTMPSLKKGEAFGAGRHLEWRIRGACSPLDACGAWQLPASRTALRVFELLSGRDTKKSRAHEKRLCLVSKCVRP